MQQVAKYLEDVKRTIRNEAWNLWTDRMLKDREGLDKLFSELGLAAPRPWPTHCSHDVPKHFKNTKQVPEQISDLSPISLDRIECF